MPTYDYDCSHCGPVEVFQSIKAPALTACPQCGSTGFTKRISTGAGIIFKGSGFYETDYRRAGESKTGTGTKADKPETRTETTPEAKTKTETTPAATPATPAAPAKPATSGST